MDDAVCGKMSSAFNVTAGMLREGDAALLDFPACAAGDGASDEARREGPPDGFAFSQGLSDKGIRVSDGQVGGGRGRTAGRSRSPGMVSSILPFVRGISVRRQIRRRNI